MCGIVGYIGHREAYPIIIKGLKRLEYRGYDSAGVMLHDGENLKICKTKGKVADLEEKATKNLDTKGNIGMGHTRWATHGAPTAANAHPHATAELALVHNGIIENFRQLRDALSARKLACAGTCPEAAQIDTAVAAVEAALAGATPQALGPTRALRSLAAIDGTYVEAVSLINEGRYEPAVALLEEALWSAGPHPDLLTYLGYANRKLGNYDTAGSWYRAALAAAPSHRGALEYYGELKLQRGDRRGALAHLARLEQLCGFGCVQADELRVQIAEAGQSAS